MDFRLAQGAVVDTHHADRAGKILVPAERMTDMESILGIVCRYAVLFIDPHDFAVAVSCALSFIAGKYIIVVFAGFQFGVNPTGGILFAFSGHQIAVNIFNSEKVGIAETSPHKYRVAAGELVGFAPYFEGKAFLAPVRNIFELNTFSRRESPRFSK